MSKVKTGFLWTWIYIWMCRGTKKIPLPLPSCLRDQTGYRLKMFSWMISSSASQTCKYVLAVEHLLDSILLLNYYYIIDRYFFFFFGAIAWFTCCYRNIFQVAEGNSDLFIQCFNLSCFQLHLELLFRLKFNSFEVFSSNCWGQVIK